MLGFDQVSIKSINIVAGGFNILSDAASAIQSILFNTARGRKLRRTQSSISLQPYWDNVTVIKVYDRSCLPSFNISQSCVVIVSTVFFTADTKQFTNSSLQDAVYPRIGSSMGPSGVFLSLMDNPRAVEVLYLGPGEINLPDDIKPASSTGVETPILVGSIVGSVVVGLAFLLVIIWIVYKRSRQGIVKLNMDPDDFPIEYGLGSPSGIQSTPSSSRHGHSLHYISHSQIFRSSSSHSHRSDCVLNDSSVNPVTNVHDACLQLDITAGHDGQMTCDGSTSNRSTSLHSYPSQDVSSIVGSDPDFIISRIKARSSVDNISVLDDSDVSSIDDEMIRTLENLIRVDDWPGIASDIPDDLSVDNNMVEEESFSKAVDYEEVQRMLSSGEWEKLSHSSSRDGTDWSSANLSLRRF
jgi:hypothetical protein